MYAEVHFSVEGIEIPRKVLQKMKDKIVRFSIDVTMQITKDGPKGKWRK